MTDTTTTEVAGGVAQVLRFGPPGAPPRLLLEVPHGATELRHFQALAAQLHGPLPDGLAAFFHVNTDEGAPELAAAIAARLGTRVGGVLLRSTIPRTLIDCNRIVTGTVAAGMTAGIPAYVREPADHERLLELHARYTRLAEEAHEEVCGGGGLALALHTYAPRSIEVPVDDGIVAALRREYRTGVVERWPLRPEIDLITGSVEGESLAPAGWVERARSYLGGAGLEVAENATYALHPATAAHRHALAHPGRVLCLEVRRDLLGAPWLPFAESAIDAGKVARVADPLARALEAQLAATPGA